MSTISLGMVLLSLMLVTCEISALKCWRCASDTADSGYCGEKLDLSQLTPERRKWIFVECTPPKDPKNIYGEKMVSKCRMQIQSINKQNVYSRHCVVEAENAERTACIGRNVHPEVKMVASETCREDGCNENFSEKPAELKIENDNNAGMKTIYLIQLFAIGFVSAIGRLLF